MKMKCPRCDETMEKTDEDSRQEWHEINYECIKCGKKITNNQVYDQNGLIISDKNTEEDKDEKD